MSPFDVRICITRGNGRASTQSLLNTAPSGVTQDRFAASYSRPLCRHSSTCGEAHSGCEGKQLLVLITQSGRAFVLYGCAACCDTAVGVSFVIRPSSIKEAVWRAQVQQDCLLALGTSAGLARCVVDVGAVVLATVVDHSSISSRPYFTRTGHCCR